MKSTERRIMKNKKHAELHEKKICDHLERKAARRATEEELQRYGGAVFHLMHHVFKAD